MKALITFATYFLVVCASWSYAKGLNLSPVFSTAQDSAEFEFDFLNSSDQVVNLPKLIQESSILLDGKEYPLLLLKFAGRDTLGPQKTWTYFFSLDGYVLGAQKQSFSKKLSRWRWQSAIKPGKHTLTLKFAGQKSSPISFRWESNGPLLYE
jgi:hypothetical protein